MYESLNAAAKGLLGDATAIANRGGIEFVVCGGWSPFLRNSSVISHPGTRDVDILFSEGADKGSLKGVVNEFLKSGYIVSAKCEFQVLRVISVEGIEFVFNVDLLHPHEGTLAGEFCVDQLSLPIRHEDFKSTFVFMKSIALSNSGFVFDGYFENELIDFKMPDGTALTLEVPVIDEVGLLATKSKSCTQRSRPRDIFDIYLAIAYPRCPIRFRQQLERLRERHNNVYASLECIGRALDDWEGEFGPPEVFAKCDVDFADAVKVMRSFLVELDFPGNKLSEDFDSTEP